MSSTPHDVDARIARYASGSFDDSTPLAQAGIDSLALLRLAVESVAASDTEIDASRLVTLRTVGDVKGWLSDIATAPSTRATTADGAPLPSEPEHPPL